MSLIFGPESLIGAEARGSTIPIRLDLVALHEFGHSLGLAHDSSSALSIMDPYYNAGFDINYLLSGQDPAVGILQSLYSDSRVAANSTSWKDSLDPNPGDGVVQVTFSFMKDGASMDKGKNTLFQTMNSLFGSPSVWQPIFSTQLDSWAAVSNGNLSFLSKGNESLKYAFNVSGQTQNDSRFGDIRIGAHLFDGGGKVLAHAYYPPPNGRTAAGDAHFDKAEKWVLSSGTLSTSGQGKGGKGNLELGETNSGTLLNAVPYLSSTSASAPVAWVQPTITATARLDLAPAAPVVVSSGSHGYGQLAFQAIVSSAQDVVLSDQDLEPLTLTPNSMEHSPETAPQGIEENLPSFSLDGLFDFSTDEDTDRETVPGQLNNYSPAMGLFESDVAKAALALVFAGYTSMPKTKEAENE